MKRLLKLHIIMRDPWGQCGFITESEIIGKDPFIICTPEGFIIIQRICKFWAVRQNHSTLWKKSIAGLRIYFDVCIAGHISHLCIVVLTYVLILTIQQPPPAEILQVCGMYK